MRTLRSSQPVPYLQTLQAVVSLKLCSFKDGARHVRSCDLLRRVPMSVQADQSTRIESIGRSNLLQTRHVGQIVLDSELSVTMTPATLFELSGLYAHALACKVRLSALLCCVQCVRRGRCTSLSEQTQLKQTLCVQNVAHASTGTTYSEVPFAMTLSNAQQPPISSRVPSSASHHSECFSRASSLTEKPYSRTRDASSSSPAQSAQPSVPATCVLFDLDVSVPCVSVSLQSSHVLDAQPAWSSQGSTPYALTAQLQNAAVMIRSSRDSTSQDRSVACSATHARVLKLQNPGQGYAEHGGSFALVPALQTLCATISGNSCAAYQLKRPRRNQLCLKAFVAWSQHVKVRS